MIEFLKILFGLEGKKENNEPIGNSSNQSRHHDIIDYDGMGNQGRFVKKGKNKK